MAINNNSSSSSYLRTILDKEKLNGTNFLDWSRNLRIVLRQEKKLYVLEQPIPEEPAPNASNSVKNAYKKHSDDDLDVARLMLGSMTSDIQNDCEEMDAFTMIGNLWQMFQKQARVERFRTLKALMSCKLARGSPVSPHVLKMKSYFEELTRLGLNIDQELAIDLILQSLPDTFDQFVINYNMNGLEKSIPELHGMLQTAEDNISKPTTNVLMVQKGKGMKKKGKPLAKGKGKSKNLPKAESKAEPNK